MNFTAAEEAGVLNISDNMVNKLIIWETFKNRYCATPNFWN